MANKKEPIQIPTLTKREYFAAMAMQGLLASDVNFDLTTKAATEIAINHADALIKELEKDNTKSETINKDDLFHLARLGIEGNSKDAALLVAKMIKKQTISNIDMVMKLSNLLNENKNHFEALR